MKSKLLYLYLFIYINCNNQYYDDFPIESSESDLSKSRDQSDSIKENNSIESSTKSAIHGNNANVKSNIIQKENIIPESWKRKITINYTDQEPAHKIISCIADACEMAVNICSNDIDNEMETRKIKYSAQNIRGIDCIIQICQQLKWRYIIHNDGSITISKNTQYWHDHKIGLLSQISKTNINQVNGNNVSISNTSTEIDSWNDIQNAIAIFIQSSGGKYYINRSAGIINVFALQEEHQKIDSYLYELLNKEKSIALELHIAILDHNENREYGTPKDEINFKFLYDPTNIKKHIQLSQLILNGKWSNFDNVIEEWFCKLSASYQNNKKEAIQHSDIMPIKTGLFWSFQPIIRDDGTITIDCIMSISSYKSSNIVDPAILIRNPNIDTSTISKTPIITTRKFNNSVNIESNTLIPIFAMTISTEELKNIGIDIETTKLAPEGIWGFIKSIFAELAPEGKWEFIKSIFKKIQINRAYKSEEVELVILIKAHEVSSKIYDKNMQSSLSEYTYKTIP